MSKFIANPVEVEAFEIGGIHSVNGQVTKVFCGDREFEITPGMTSRISPKIGDYVVIQADGYVYLNPKEVFERKYSPKPMAMAAEPNS